MAMSQKERDVRRAEKAARVQEEELRLKVRPGTKKALAELMQWAGLEEQGEAMTLMIHHLQALGPAVAVRFLTPPRHEITISESMERKLTLAYQREALRICCDD
jgi:hypothetical protein